MQCKETLKLYTHIKLFTVKLGRNFLVSCKVYDYEKILCIQAHPNTAKSKKDFIGLLWMTKRTFVDMRYKCKQSKKWRFRLSFPLYLSNLPGGGVMTLGLSMAPPPIKVGGHCSFCFLTISELG